MRSIFFLVAFFAAHSYSTAQNVQVFGVGIEIRENCEVVVSPESRMPENLKFNFSSAGKCRILPNSETNIPRLEFIQSEYVLLIESMAIAGGTCRAELAAITFSRDGRLRLSPKTPNTSACGSAERKDYEILRYRSGK